MTAKRAKPAPGGGEALEKLRALCLSLPETSERTSWGHPSFLAGKKTFVTFERVRGALRQEPARPSIAFRLDRIDVGQLLHDERFFATPYGRGQWISLWADIALDWGLVRDLALRSYRLVALKRMLAVLDGAGYNG